MSSSTAVIRFFGEPFERAWHYRELIQVILWRELAARFRQSYFSWGWAVLAPLVMLALYTIVFSDVLQISAAADPATQYAPRLFVGLIIYNLSVELISRAPTLMHEHAPFLKKSMFPSEALAWIAVLRALVYSGISLAVLLAFELVFFRSIPLTVLLLPFVVAPLCLGLLGVTWFLAALGAFTRDVSYLIVTFVPVLLFVTPVFYRVSDMPDAFRIMAYCNPLTIYIEMSRQLLLAGTVPSLLPYLSGVAVSVCVFLAGRAFFVRYRNVMIDVI
jgi:lipopolysaccharide transport system permease protein